MHPSGAEAIAGALGMNYIYYQSSIRPGEREMGVAVLSAWPIVASEKVILPHTTRVVHRMRIAAVAHRARRGRGRPRLLHALRLAGRDEREAAG